jgi:ATP-dependent Clp endopeptidase proteolytic subunit ClpP
VTNIDQWRRAVAHSRSVQPDWFRVVNAAQDQTTDPTVYIYGPIGDGWLDPEEVPASAFVRAFDAIDADHISIRINSPGGFVSDGVAIANSIRRHKAHVSVTVDGVAASAASFIALAGDELTMARNSELMIHNPIFMAMGNADEMRSAADRLESIADNIADMYAAKAGGDIADWRQAMNAETWYSAEEAVAIGLADRVDTDHKAKDEAKNQFDLSVFAHAGRKAAPAPFNLAPLNHKPPAEPAEPPHPTQKGADMASDTFISGLRERLGINAEAELDEAGLLAALDEALSEQTEPTTEAPEGTVLVASDMLASLQAQAAQGAEARAQQLADRRESLITAALNEGRITAASVADWRESLTGDPQAVAKSERVLASLAKNTVPVEPLGYTGDAEASADDDSYPAHWKR